MKAMAEFIEREAFLEDVEKRYCLPCQEGGKDRNGCMCRACWVDDMCGEVIGAPAADVAPVVRCKDCQNLRQSGTGWYCCEYGGTITPQDYCSRAERITNVGATECVPWEAD